MKIFRILLWIGAALLLLIVSLTWMEHAEAPTESTALIPILLTGPEGSKRTLFVEIASDAQERAKGLMSRTELNPASGMLFVFQQSEQLTFWMKNTLIPLDILFFDDKGVFVSRTSMDPCLEDPCVSYSSERPARYALEVNRDERGAAGVGSGWLLFVP